MTSQENFAGCTISCKDGSEEKYDGCIIGAHAPDALRMLGKEATFDETRILGAFQYAYRCVFVCFLLCYQSCFFATFNDKNLIFDALWQ